MQDDPRPVPGFPYHADAVLICLPQLCEVTLIDISMHGALVWPKGNVEIKVGDKVRLRVLTEKGNQAFEVQALVAHRTERIIGLEISAVDHHAMGTLRRLIGIDSGTPDLASRTLPVLLKSNLRASPMSV
jgi:hypothetical protein